MNFVASYFNSNQSISSYASASPSTVMTSILSNHKLKQVAKARGIDITSVTWEDVGRSKNSCWGKNISDMTLKVSTQLCPVLRRPNFLDLTCDLPLDDFKVSVGNETGQKQLVITSLRQYLSTMPSKNGLVNLIKERDTHLLVSSQACVLPLKDGKVEFRPTLYNYQTRNDSSALLVVLSTSTGTSSQIMFDKPQDLVYNLDGQFCHFLATRLRDDRAARGVALEGKMDAEEIERNLIAIYCIPLKQKPVEYLTRGGGSYSFGFGAPSSNSAISALLSQGEMLEGLEDKSQCLSAQSDGMPDDDDDDEGGFECSSFQSNNREKDRDSAVKTKGKARGVDHAMLNVGEPKGTFKYSPKDYIYERDEKYPIRLTLQRYRVTDTADIKPDVIQEIADVIQALYAKATATGSLVVDGDTKRVTESAKLPIPAASGERLSALF